MGRANPNLYDESAPVLSPRYGLKFSHLDGLSTVTGGLDEANMRIVWARWVLRLVLEGYQYRQLSDTSGCAYKVGSTINVELVTR